MGSIQKSQITITDAKITTAIDEKLMPVGITDIFPKGTSKVFCWFKWKNAKVNTGLIAHWHFVTDNIPILDYNFNIPCQEETGSNGLFWCHCEPRKGEAILILVEIASSLRSSQ